MADPYIPPPVTPLQAGFPTLAPGATSGSSTGTATETPFGATKVNPLGVEQGPLIRRQESNQEIGGLVKEQGENQVNRAVMGQEQAEQKIAAQGTDVDDLHRFHDEFTKDFNARKERMQKMEDDIRAASKFHDHFTDKNIGDKIIATIASAALGFGTGRAANVVADIEAMDHAKQEKQLAALMETGKMMGANDEQLRKFYDDSQQHMLTARKLRFEAIAAEFEKQAAMATTVEKATEARMNAAQYKNLANEVDLKQAMSLRVRSSKAATSSAKPVTPTKRY